MVSIVEWVNSLAAESREPTEGVRAVSSPSASSLDPAELERIAGEFDSDRQAIVMALREFAIQVENIRRRWEGRASLGFQNAASVYEDRQNSLVRVLTASAESLRAYAGTSRAATEEAAAAVNIQMPL